MEKIQKYGVAIAGIVLSVLFSVIAVKVMSPKKLGDGIYNQTAQYFAQGLFAGLNNQMSVDSTGTITSNGITTKYVRQAIVTGGGLNLGTTTPCAIQNPLNATSTILSTSMNITVSTSTAGLFSVGTTTTAFATSSNLFTTTVGANTQNTLNFDPSNNNGLIGPLGWIVYGVQGAPGIGNGFIYQGTCQAVLQSAN